MSAITGKFSVKRPGRARDEKGKRAHYRPPRTRVPDLRREQKQGAECDLSAVSAGSRTLSGRIDQREKILPGKKVKTPRNRGHERGPGSPSHKSYSKPYRKRSCRVKNGRMPYSGFKHMSALCGDDPHLSSIQTQGSGCPGKREMVKLFVVIGLRCGVIV